MHVRTALLLLCTITWPAAADSLFDNTEPIAVTIAGPLGAIARDDSPEPEDRPGTLTWRDAAGTDHAIPIEVRPRGKSRRRDTVCQFPPLRLDFPKEGTEGTPFAGLGKVKLVTHCTRLGKNDAKAEQRLRLEYLVYYLYQALTPESFRVRPVTITYVDGDRGKGNVHPGFLLEPDEMLAARLQSTVVDAPKLERSALDSARANRVEVFEYFIGNTDFSLVSPPEGRSCCHNTVPLQPAIGPIIPVPYDFDSTGVVDPPYAEPLPMLKISDVRQRLYRGHCRAPDVLPATLDAFRAAKADFYAVIQNDTVLDERSKRSTIEFFDAFYEILGSPEEVQKRIVSRCI
jgi:hypothetical protein